MQTPHVKTFKVAQYLVLAFLVLAIGYHLAEKQLVNHQTWKSRLAAQYDKDFTIRQNRAHIADRHGFQLAVSTKAYSIYGIGSEIENTRDAASRIAQAMGMADYGPIYNRIAGRTGFFWIARNVDPLVASRIGTIKGVGLLEGERRFYPDGDLFGKLLGFTGVDIQGLEGIEHRFDERLKGQEVRVAVYRDARRRDIMLEPISTQQNSLKKPPLTLSVDSRLQAFVESSVQQFLQEHEAKAISVVAMDPFNGEVLSIYSWPSYDPNNFSNYPRQRWRNDAIANTFEPGSTFKLITYAAALKSRSITLQDIFFGENGEYREGNRTIRDTVPMGWASVAEAFGQSSNVITSKIAAQIPAEVFHSTIRDFGFGAATGIELSGESAGLLRPPSQWSRLSQTSLSMGYEISVNALQMVRAYAAAINGGYLVQPTILKGANQGREWEAILDPQTADAMKSLLLRVVEKGTGRNASHKYFTIGGKTGTAQKLDPVEGYTRDRHLASFVGFFPYEQPQVVMGVFIDEPKVAVKQQNAEGPVYVSSYGGAVAAPLFRDIAGKYINYYTIVPDRKSN